MSVELTSIFNEESIVRLTSRTKSELLREMADVLANRCSKGEGSELEAAFLSREALMSTGIGRGMAVPHIRIKGVNNIVALMGISPEGVSDYESMDDKPVRIIVMIIAGEGQHRLYIQFLAKIVAFLKKDNVSQKILADPFSKPVLALMTEQQQGV